MMVNSFFPNVYVLEPSFGEKKRFAASTFKGKQKRKEIEELKKDLLSIRQGVREELPFLIERFSAKIKEFDEVYLHFAERAEDVARLVKEKADSLRYISLNKSNVVVNEIRPFLEHYGFRVYLRYYSEFRNFDPSKKAIIDYFMLPSLHERNIIETFEIEKVFDLSKGEPREYMAILGVNAASTQDGSLFFLQHMSNISKDLLEARKLFFVIPVEKLVRDKGEAILQVQAMGIFGLESLLLDLEPKEDEIFAFESLPSSSSLREIHMIILDNGRKDLLSTPFSDLLLCIDCRACARQCPVGTHIRKGHMIYSPKNMLLSYLQGKNPPFEFCLHCGRCEMECPLGINLPKLLWLSQLQYYERRKRGLKKMLLDNPEVLAKLGTFFSPLSNHLLNLKFVRVLMELFSDIHREANLPSFQKKTFRAFIKGKRNG